MYQITDEEGEEIDPEDSRRKRDTSVPVDGINTHQEHIRPKRYTPIPAFGFKVVEVSFVLDAAFMQR